MAAAAAPAPQPGTQSPEGLISRLGGKVRKWKDAATQAAKERDEALAKLADADKQIKDLAGKADGNEAAKQRDTAVQELKTLKHQLKFNELAKAAGATTEAQQKDLWQLSGYKAEADAPDEKAIGALIEAQKKERSYLFGDLGQQTQQTETAQPGPSRGKGSSDAANQGIFSITRAQANDPLFMRDNRDRINQAQKENRFVLEPQTLIR